MTQFPASLQSRQVTISRRSPDGTYSMTQTLGDLVSDLPLRKLLVQSKEWLQTIHAVTTHNPESISQKFLIDYSNLKHTPLLIQQALHNPSKEAEARDAAALLLLLFTEITSALQGIYQGLPQDRKLRRLATNASANAESAGTN